MKNYFNYSILLLFLSYLLYLIVISDWILSYEIFADIPLGLFLYASLILFIFTVARVIKTKQLPSKLSILIFIVTIACYLFTFGKRNGLFWGRRILNAAFIDDRSRMDLELYQNGKYTIYSNWLFGENRFEGNYKLDGDTIIFSKTPVTDNDFISHKIMIDRNKNRIYFRKRDENYDKSFYYFQIDF